MDLDAQTLSGLSPSELWSAMDPASRETAARCLYRDRDARREADLAIATTLRFREVAVRKLSIDQRVGYVVQRVRPDDSLASSLLIALHLGARSEMLSAFLQQLSIPEEDGVIDADHDLEPPEKESLKAAVDMLYERFPRDAVQLYLASLVALDEESWGGLVSILDARG